ncbi:MAG: DUF47 family protein [Bacteroidales bacterium]|nr:DUF47 family protein [Bacteroidales bacterium]
MKLDDILQIFVVKEKKFFPLFVQSAENIKKGAEHLVKLTLEEDFDHRDSLSRRIQEYENEEDEVTTKIMNELLDSYVTPFDRDDVHDLALALDTVMDNIRDSAKKIAIYQPKGVEPKLTEISQLLVDAADKFIEMTSKFDNIRKNSEAIDDICNQVREIEHNTDDIYASFMSHLFKEEKDTVELIKKKNIVQALEDTCDSAKVVSDLVRSILVKMS